MVTRLNKALATGRVDRRRNGVAAADLALPRGCLHCCISALPHCRIAALLHFCIAAFLHFFGAWSFIPPYSVNIAVLPQKVVAYRFLLELEIFPCEFVGV